MAPDPEAARRPPTAGQEASGPGSPPDVTRLAGLADDTGILVLPLGELARLAAYLTPHTPHPADVRRAPALDPAAVEAARRLGEVRSAAGNTSAARRRRGAP